MPIVLITRLQLRSLRFYPVFMWHSMASVRQLKRSEGFLDGMLAQEGRRAFWTFSVWADDAAMRGFRDTAAHHTAMPKLLDWCDEASVTRFEQQTSDIPSCTEALSRMKSGFRPSKVRHPSIDHAMGRLPSSLSVPRPGLRLKPQPKR